MSIVSALLLLGITAFLVYGAINNYHGFKQMSSLREELYTEDIQPEKFDAQIAEVRQHLEKSPNPPDRLLLFNLLLMKAVYYPDDCAAQLREALDLGQELYRTLPAVHGPVGTQLAFAYLYAGLPSKLPSWRTEVAARDPQYRAQLSLLTFYGLVLSDNLDGAQALLDDEVAAYGKHTETRAMAAAGYHQLGLEHEARQLALEEDALAGISSRLRSSYAQFLLDIGDFEAAETVLRGSLEDMPGDPDRALELALCLAVIRGIDNAEVERLLDTAAGSLRDPRSRDGVRALCLAGMYGLEGNTASAEQLLDMADLAQTDFFVQLAFTELALELGNRGVDESIAFRGQREISPGIGDAVGLARNLLALADSPARYQIAHLQLALALTHSAKGVVEPRTILAEAAEHFDAALGSPADDGITGTDRIPDYDLVLLDPGVIELRKASPDFDQALHRSVVDLLNRRRLMFNDVVSLPTVEYTR